MFLNTKRRRGVACVAMAAFFVGILLLSPVDGFAGDARKVRTRIQPLYPEIARQARIEGMVKVEAVVSPSGDVREARVIGGHPLLAAAAMDAVKRWKYEPASAQSTLVVEFNFRNGM